MVSPHVALIATTVNYTLGPTLFLEGTAGHSLAYQGGCFGVGGGGGPQFCNAFPVTRTRTATTSGSSGCRSSFRRRPSSTSGTSSTTCSTRANRRCGTAPGCCCRRRFSWGNRVTNTPPNIGFPSQNIASTTDVSISLTKVWGRHTIKTGFYNQHSDKQQVQGGGAGGPVAELPAGHGRAPIPATRRSGSPMRRSAASVPIRRGRRASKGEYVYNNTEALHPGQLEGEPEAHARLRRPVRPPEPQYDKRGQALQLLHRPVAKAAGAGAVRRGLRQRRVPVHGHQPSGA